MTWCGKACSILFWNVQFWRGTVKTAQTCNSPNVQILWNFWRCRYMCVCVNTVNPYESPIYLLDQRRNASQKVELPRCHHQTCWGQGPVPWWSRPTTAHWDSAGCGWSTYPRALGQSDSPCAVQCTCEALGSWRWDNFIWKKVWR